MQLFTQEEVIQLIEKFCKPFETYAKAAERIGCTQSQLNVARTGQQPPCPAILKAIKIDRTKVYVSGLEKKYKE